MSDNAEIHSKILSFLAGEIARKEGRQCVAVDLVFTPGGGFRDDEIRKWVRADSPDLFDNFVTPGRHRFEVRTHQHLGGRARQSFVLSPSYNGGDELSLVPTNGARQDATAATVLMNHAGQLMRTNAQIFDGTIRVLAATNSDMRRENAELHAENILLRREVDEARSNKMDREFDIAMQAEKNARTNAGFQKLMQLGTVVAAKIGGNENQPGEQTPVGMLIGEFGKSLRKDQIDVLMNTLDMAQKIMFFEIMNMVSPEQSKPNTGPASLPSSSGNGSSSP
jgi:hypothetical protein